MPKKRILVPRTVTIKRITRTVMFLLDTGGTSASWVCHRTLAEFGLTSKQLKAQGSNFIRGEVQNVGQSLFMLDPHGAHHDLNILGMDYLMKVDASIQINGQKEEIQLSTKL